MESDCIVGVALVGDRKLEAKQEFNVVNANSKMRVKKTVSIS